MSAVHPSLPGFGGMNRKQSAPGALIDAISPLVDEVDPFGTTTLGMMTGMVPKTTMDLIGSAVSRIDALGDEYKDFHLVITGLLGMPVEARRINGAFDKLIKKNNLPKVVFHSLRHSSITYKLKLNGGDIKAVQGDSGHAQSKMVTDLYSHILDDDRRQNAQLFEEAFYSGRNQQPQGPAPDAADAALLMKLLQNPEMAALIKTLAKTLQ